MNRRAFLASMLGAAGALVLPEPKRIRTYSFMPGIGREDELLVLLNAFRDEFNRHIRESPRAYVHPDTYNKMRMFLESVSDADLPDTVIVRDEVRQVVIDKSCPPGTIIAPVYPSRIELSINFGT